MHSTIPFSTKDIDALQFDLNKVSYGGSLILWPAFWKIFVLEAILCF